MPRDAEPGLVGLLPRLPLGPDASPEDTLDQVEALQQAWVEGTGIGQDTAVAVLINRNPDDPEGARAGVFVGRTSRTATSPSTNRSGLGTAVTTSSFGATV